MNGKVPWSQEYELAYLGTLFRGDELSYKLSEECFHNPENRKAYSVISNKIKEVHVLDMVMAREVLIKDMGMSGEKANKFIVSCVDSVGFGGSLQEKYGKELKKLKAQRDAIELGNRISSGAMKGGEEDLGELLSKAIDDIYAIGANGSEETVVTTEGFYEEYGKHIERISTGTPIGYQTGIRVLDENCDGLQPGTVMRLNAYSNIGKTRLAVFVLANLLKQGISCVFYSTEVTAQHFFPIYASTVLGIPFKDVKEGRADIDWDILDSLPFKFYQDKYSLNEIMFSAKKHKPKVIMIDFAQNIDAGHLSDEYKNMSMYAREIQKFAITNNIAVFDLSQVSNEGAKMGSASNVIASKGSGALVASADVGLLLTRESFTPEATILKLDIKKNKYGPLASAELAVDYRTSNYQEFNDSEI